MAEENQKAIKNDQEIIKPAGGKKAGDDLSEEDLEKAAGGKVTDKTTPILL